jgi:predicted NAD/FAD-dependent oxidoreductase
MLLPKLALGALFPAAAAHYVEQRGGAVRTGALVTRLARAGQLWQVETAGTRQDFDAVVLATPAWQAAALLQDQPGGAALAAQLAAFDYEPITTCYLQYPPSLRLGLPFCALLDDPAANAWGQFVFDRGQLDPDNAGLLAVVVSAAGDAAQLERAALAASIAAQLAQAFGRPELAHPQWTKVITEKRATFACTPGLRRPECATALPGLVLAGDYTASDYPATLESAVRSGRRAATAILSYGRLPREKRSLSQPDGRPGGRGVQ